MQSTVYLCQSCNGTGIDASKTKRLSKDDAVFRHNVKHSGSYVMCWDCNGNGLDPAEYFRWGHTNS